MNLTRQQHQISIRKVGKERKGLDACCCCACCCVYLLDRQQQQQRRCNKLQYARGLPAPHLLLQHHFLLLSMCVDAAAAAAAACCLHRGIKIHRPQTTLVASCCRACRFASSSTAAAAAAAAGSSSGSVYLYVCSSSARAPRLVLGERLWQSAISRYVNFMLTNQFEI